MIEYEKFTQQDYINFDQFLVDYPYNPKAIPIIDYNEFKLLKGALLIGKTDTTGTEQISYCIGYSKHTKLYYLIDERVQ